MMDDLDISAIIKAVLTPHADRPRGALIEMKPGDQLSARVLKIAQDGRVWMELGGSRAVAQIGFPVQIGQRLQLRVVTTGSVLQLKVDSGGSEDKSFQHLPHTDFLQVVSRNDRKRFVNIVARMTPKGHGLAAMAAVRPGVQASLAKISTAFEHIPVGDSAQEISRWVKRVVEDRGVLFEKQLADAATATAGAVRSGIHETSSGTPVHVVISNNVKSQLIQIRNNLTQIVENPSATDELNAGDIRFLRRTVEQLLGHIEQQQDRAVANWQDGDIQQTFVHTLELPNQKKPVQLKVFYPRKEGKETDHQQHRMALLLNMDALGLMRVDLAMLSRKLTIGFFVAHTAVKQLMEDHIQKVETALAGQFDEVLINVTVSQKKIKQFDQHDHRGAESGRIDLNA
jgi:hypothetical protein